MRYNHESYLPIGAFQPILGRMRLHGGGGNPLDTFSDMIGTGGGDTGLLNMVDEGVQGASDVLATVDDAILQPVTAPISQLTSALDEAVIQPITAPISDVGVAIDDAVADVIPGGWGTLAQVAAAATGNPYIIGATSAGVNFAKNKDLKSAVEAGLISGGTAGITQGLGDAFQLGDIGRAGVSAGIGGALDYAKTGDINSALKAGAMSGGQSYLGGKLGEYASPYLNEIKGDFGQYLQDKGLALSGPSDQINVQNVGSQPAVENVSQSVYNSIDRDLGIPSGISSGFDPDLGMPGVRYDLDPDLGMPGTSFESGFEETAGYDPKADFTKDPYKYLSQKGVEGKDYVVNKTTGAIDYLSNTNPLDYPGDLYDAAKNYYNESSPTKIALTAAGLYGLSNLGGGSTEQAQSAAAADAANKVYTYGTAGPSSPNYLLKNRINASNVYSPATGYRPVTRYADGGEVQHFGLGGKVADFATRITQPFEKAVLRPIGEAAPFLKDLAPYAGIAAGALMGNPAMAAGIGGLASGFGKPGGFDMKRALMGGIAAYGMSNLAGGIEAAGTEPSILQTMDAPNISGSADYLKEIGLDNTTSGLGITTSTGPAVSANPTFRNPEAMQKGISNLLENSNTPEYKNAMGAFTKNAGIYNAGVPLIMGTTGMMGVDESNAYKRDYDKAAAESQSEVDRFNARVAAGKKRAQQAVSENPYMFAMGGQINPPDDQTGMPNQTPLQNFEHGGVYSYAQGGDVQRFGFGGAITPIIERLIAQQDAEKANPPTDTNPYMSIGRMLNVIGPQNSSSETPTTIPESSVATVSAEPTSSLQPKLPMSTSSPNRSIEGQYLVSNPQSLQPLSAANIYEYQKKQRGYAGGGVPRFLSGGGDGMSDSIRANIEGSQEARLADGEFVIPADVVSHLGNGSSKAGAKQLYDMMDRVRKARTGNPKQGREIKPTKLMPV